MADNSKPRIERAIAHQVNPRIADGVVFSTRELPLAQYPNLVSYLQAHIANSGNHHDIRSARFKKEDTPNEVKGICQKLIEGKIGFVKGTRLLAERLTALLEDRTRSPGTLAACFFSDNAESQERQLALLKLDPTATVVQRTIVDGNDKVVVWEPAENALPSTEQELQKCALVQIPKSPSDFDLWILDWQNRGSQEPAKFFTGDFLQAELHADRPQLTRMFHTKASRAIESLRPKVGNKKADGARRLINGALFSNRISVARFVESLDLDDEDIAIVEKNLKASIRGAFRPDEEVAQKLTAKRTIVGDFGLKVSAESDHFDRVVKLGVEKDDPQYGPYREITVRAYGFEEK